ncbi:glycoside hydrolase family 43 protein [Sorangium sp. So ce1335]|uniref:glycoside hydrolase family 43 protein n=1 Tax=Sorangium sp. So ce1335 TaxID=3133335 RepID=UPI003F6276D4
MTLTAMALAIGAALPSPARADNPIVQTFYTADPAPMVHEGTLYLYTSHDEDVSVNNFYTMNDWRLYSTTDMVNWRDHGSVASYRTFRWGTGDAWAPQGIARNGKYYLYVPLNNATGARIGVGVSDNVAGPFMDPLGKELAATGSGNIDPTVFVDDDGQAYMYWGNGTLRYVKLNSDMISTSGSITNVPLNGFTEGPWLYKRGSLYYLVYAAISGTEKISYATSNSPTGPWSIRGDIMDAGRTYTNHAGIVDYKGHSYFFYHNSALPGGGDFKRSVCVEEFTYGADGSIPKITMSTNGPSAVDTLNPFSQVEAETIAFSSGLKTEACTDTGGGMNVTSISNGDYIKVKNVDFLDGVTSFEARVSSAAGDAKIELRLDSQNGTLLGTCDVSGASSWTTKTCTVSGGSGKHDLFLKFVGGGGDLFKFNWWRFTGPTTPDGEGGGGGAGGSAGAGGTMSGSGGSVAGGTGGTTDPAGSGSGGSADPSGGAGGGGDAAGAGGRGDSTQAASGSGGNGADGADADGSCGCRTGASAGHGGFAAALSLVASALVLRRRRQRLS